MELSQKSCMIKYKIKGVALQHVVACRYFLRKVQKTPPVVSWSLHLSFYSAGRYFIQTDFFYRNFLPPVIRLDA